MRMNKPSPRRAAARVFLLLLAAGPAAFGGDEWSEPFTGVRHLHRTTDDPKWSIHLAFLDLTEPSVRVTATPPENKGDTVSGFAKKQNVQIAVNGDFFTLANRQPSGLAIGGGKVWPGSGDNAHEGFIAAGAGGRVEIFSPELVVPIEPWMQAAVGGYPMLVRNGAPAEDWPARHPRTAVGLSKDRKTLMLLVVDGRQAHSVGMTGSEMQKLFLEFGAWSALNLDGGGSTAMYLDGRIVSSPSDGRERVDANHLGVYAVKGPVRPKGQVRGFVKEQGTGRPLAGVKVAVAPSCFDVTDDKGFFHLSQVPAGQPSLTAILADHATGQFRVKVAPHQTVETVIDLAPAPPPAARITPVIVGAASAKLGTAAAPGLSDAGRPMVRARNYQKGKLWGKALDAYREVVEHFPDSPQAAEARGEIGKLAALLER